MNLLFLHGFQSTPGGLKPTYLKDHGHEVLNPHLPDDDFDAAIRIAQAVIDRHQPDVVVGSSRGGAVAMNINSGSTPLVVLCPAWKRWGTATTVKPNTIILHSRADEVVPFADSEELVRNSGLPAESLIEVGCEHRLADEESLEMMLEAVETWAPKLIGCDLGVPIRAGEQAKKIVLIEAVQIGAKRYGVRPYGRNARLVRWLAGDRKWPLGRPGWPLPSLANSLATDNTVKTASFDFPFSIPLSLLKDSGFARGMKTKPFLTRQAWVRFVSSRLRLQFTNGQANGELQDLKRFDAWRDKQFWKKRFTDEATGGSPPLKHMYQNVFAMTLAGASLLSKLEASGYNVVLDSLPPSGSRNAFETYPSSVAKRIGFQGSYKTDSVRCLDHAVKYLSKQGIGLDLDPDVRGFCKTYRTGPKHDDPDGADAFLCLVAAIASQEGMVELCGGNADQATLREEGAVISPLHVLRK